ncbi:hypothetical protein DEJ50_01185 [Streptomyces venezuelae]|uniref:Thioredoxin domain-containing protein n=1 Tax=Streptomyces venezuelae TaxID=54571 RepID=A0A5P2D0N5_STRVZ|nr:thioredoxin family protein [Streptomyces venezuelae]QES46669.1 hypothetical protein DEJ50_01185 [Streptomyces venezuelae]
MSPRLLRPASLAAAAVLAAGLTAACGPSSPSAGAAAPSAPGQSSNALPSAADDASGSAGDPDALTTPSTPSASPSTSATALPGSSATPSRGRTGSATPSRTPATRTPAKPPRTSAAPAPARIPGPGYDSSADAKKQIDAALRAAKADGRMVLLDFGANWCGNCKAADKVFAQPQTAALLGASYHLVKVDIGGNNSANFALLDKYSSGGGSYKMPVLMVVTASGTVRTDTHVTGNPALTPEGINSFLRKWAP